MNIGESLWGARQAQASQGRSQPIYFPGLVNSGMSWLTDLAPCFLSRLNGDDQELPAAWEAESQVGLRLVCGALMLCLEDERDKLGCRQGGAGEGEEREGNVMVEGGSTARLNLDTGKRRSSARVRVGR